MVYVVVVVILLWVAALTIPMSNGFLYGGASGSSAMMLVYVALIIAKRRGYETFVVRELEKRGGTSGTGPPCSGLGRSLASSGSSAMLSLALWAPSEGR